MPKTSAQFCTRVHAEALINSPTHVSLALAFIISTRLSRLRFDSEPTLQCSDSSSPSSISLQLQLRGITHCPPAHGNIGLPIDYTAGHREMDFFNNRQTQRRQSDTAVWSKWSTETIWTQSCLRPAVSFKHAGSPGSLFACHLWAPEASSTSVGGWTKRNQWRLSSFDLHHMTQKLEPETSDCFQGGSAFTLQASSTCHFTLFPFDPATLQRQN